MEQDRPLVIEGESFNTQGTYIPGWCWAPVRQIDLHKPATVLNIFREVLTGFSQVYYPDDLNIHLTLSKKIFPLLETLPLWEQWEGIYFQGQGWRKSVQLPRSMSWVNQRPHPLNYLFQRIFRSSYIQVLMPSY